MIKIITKRDRREEEALREEGRSEVRRAYDDESFQQIMNRKVISLRETQFYPAHMLEPGHRLAFIDSPRSGYLGDTITNVSSTDSNGNPCREGEIWIEGKTEHSTYGSAIDADDPVLVYVGERR